MVIIKSLLLKIRVTKAG